MEVNKNIREKSPWTRKLGEIRNFDKTRTYYYQKKELNEYGNEMIRGYYCVDCKDELNIFRHDGTNYEPYKVHKAFIQRKNIKNPSRWSNGKKIDIDYYKALCCKCYEKTPNNQDPRPEINTVYYWCDCVQYLDKEIEKKKKEIKSVEEKVRARVAVAKYLNPPQEVNKLFDDLAKKYLKEYLDKAKEQEEYYKKELGDEKRELADLFKKLKRVKEKYESKREKVFKEYLENETIKQ